MTVAASPTADHIQVSSAGSVLTDIQDPLHGDI